jgi:uncharacterized protein (UPF0261 family)
MRKSVLIISTLDTKGEQAKFVKELIEQKGHKAIVIDIATGSKPAFKADIPGEQVAKAAGSTIEEVRKLSKNEAASLIVKGASKILQELQARGELGGVIGLGGASAAFIFTSITKQLPFGVPKVLASSAVAIAGLSSMYFGFGTQDVANFNTVVDLGGMNEMVRNTLRRAAGAICGMVELTEAAPSLIDIGKRVVALTRNGTIDKCAELVTQQLEQRGYTVVAFHAQGAGDRAMDELIDRGIRFEGVIDIATQGVGEKLFGGQLSAGARRLEAAGEKGIPQVIAPGGVNLLAAWGYQTQYEGRKFFRLDASRRLVRLNKEELAALGKVVAEKLNKATGPVRFLVPLKGWSEADPEGSTLYEPDTDKAFVTALRKNLKSDKIKIIEVDAWLEEPKFAKAVVEAFEEIMG